MPQANCPYCDSDFDYTDDEQSKRPPKRLPCPDCEREMHMYAISIKQWRETAGALLIADRVVEITHGLNSMIGKSLNELTESIKAQQGELRQVYPLADS